MNATCWNCSEPFVSENYKPLCPECHAEGTAREQERQRELARAQAHAEELRDDERTERLMKVRNDMTRRRADG
jgi:hypothetical protein